MCRVIDRCAQRSALVIHAFMCRLTNEREPELCTHSVSSYEKLNAIIVDTVTYAADTVVQSYRVSTEHGEWMSECQ